MNSNSLSRPAPMGASASVTRSTNAVFEPIVREALPLHEHGPLADRRQIRKADVGPLRDRTHVDQHAFPRHASARVHVSSTDTDAMGTSPTLLSTL